MAARTQSGSFGARSSRIVEYGSGNHLVTCGPTVVLSRTIGFAFDLSIQVIDNGYGAARVLILNRVPVRLSSCCAASANSNLMRACFARRSDFIQRLGADTRVRRPCFR